MTLDVIIATYKPDGIERLSRMDLPILDGVGYIVSWQSSDDYPVPENLQRSDVSIYRMEGKGLSRNRNNAIEHSSADIVYIADDDLELMPGALTRIIERFIQFPDTVMATFRMKDDGKTYPDDVTELSFYLPKNYNVCSCQMAFRRSAFSEIKFNTSYGINSGCFESGEDEIFHLNFRKRGLVCRFFPDEVSSHPHESTGFKAITNPRTVQGMGAVMTKCYPRTFMLRIPLKAYRLKKSGRSGFFYALRHLIAGSYKSFKVKI